MDNKPTHIKATAPSGKVLTGPIDNVEMTVVTINHCITATQTAQAMEDGRKLRSGETVKRNGWLLEPFTPEAANDTAVIDPTRSASN